MVNNDNFYAIVSRGYQLSNQVTDSGEVCGQTVTITREFQLLNG